VSARGSGPVLGIAGLGYMGLATGLSFAAHGMQVYGYDLKPEIRAAVRRGHTPYSEEGLGPLLRTQLHAGRFHVVDSVPELVERSEGIFLCVPTPSLRSGRIDVRPLRRSAGEVADAIHGVGGYRLVVVKSTVVPGTTEDLVTPVVRRRSGRNEKKVGVASNPEFLAEGTMVRDALHPDRVVIGTRDSRAAAWLRRAYRPFGSPIFSLTPSGAELVKYSANAFLALKVSFANEAARLADRLGVNVDEVMEAVGHDPRIGQRFLRAGPGFGGSCFDKDVRALVTRSSDLGLRFRAGEAALRINDEQLGYVVEGIRAVVGPLRGKQLALLGLAFKAGTDDVRESRALPIAERLTAAGATVRGHDPVARENFRRAWAVRHRDAGAKLKLFEDVAEALLGADAAILQVDWPEYLDWSASWSRIMRRPVLVDLRRAVDVARARRTGLNVVGLGSGHLPSEYAPRTAGGDR
jgi:UDPglucose 6-dehydrogenase